MIQTKTLRERMMTAIKIAMPTEAFFRLTNNDVETLAQAAIDTFADAGLTVEQGWLPIETAPKDGSVILAFDPEGVRLDDRVYTWPEGAVLHVLPARWHEPNDRTHECPGWFAPMLWLSFGPWDDPSTDIDGVMVEPTHWRPLIAPPAP